MKKIFLILCIFCSIALPLGAFASDDPLAQFERPSLNGISPQKNVDYEEVTLRLSFNHNVADAAVRKNNEKQISVQTEDGENIPVTVSFSDDFADRRYIYITMTNLYPGMKYYVYVGYRILAANGCNASMDMQTTFTTKEKVEDNGSDTKHDQGEITIEEDTGGENGGQDRQDKNNTEQVEEKNEVTEEDVIILQDNTSEIDSSDDEEDEEDSENGKKTKKSGKSGKSGNGTGSGSEESEDGNGGSSGKSDKADGSSSAPADSEVLSDDSDAVEKQNEPESEPDNPADAKVDENPNQETESDRPTESTNSNTGDGSEQKEEDRENEGQFLTWEPHIKRNMIAAVLGIMLIGAAFTELKQDNDL